MKGGLKHTSQNKIPITAVVGPTASGKSDLAVEIALQRNGEVISADSMQIYRGMAVGTAQPSEAEKCGIPHHLIGFADPREPFSVADYTAMASACILEVSARGKLPVLVGGTGLYIRSLLHNIQFSEAGRDDALRAELAARAEAEGPGSLLEELRSFDPESAARLHPNNLGRIIRAIEVYRLTGKTITDQIAHSREAPSPYQACVIGLNYKNRQMLYDRINHRVSRMLADGLEQEARCLLACAPLTAAQAIGYKEFIPYFSGDCTLWETVEAIRRGSRRYAKRQLTWFRRDEEIHWIYVDAAGEPSRVLNEALTVLDRAFAATEEVDEP